MEELMKRKSVEELVRIRNSCRAMVRKRAVVSGGASLIPIPGADVAADVGMLMALIPAINRQFGLTPEQIDKLNPRHQMLIYGMIKKAGTDLVGKAVTQQLLLATLRKVGVRTAAKQVLKYLPLFGQVGAAAMSAAAFAYIGNSHVDECFDIAKDANRG